MAALTGKSFIPPNAARSACAARAPRWLRLLHAFGTAALLSLAVSAARAEGTEAAGDGQRLRGVVEFFTSQGCNSCPPADRLAEELTTDPSLIILSWHVQYWDFLGWRDTLGLPQADARQRAYAALFNARSVYTPQAVVNGAEGMVGSRQALVAAALGQLPPPLAIRLEAENGVLSISLPDVENDARALIEIIRFAPSRNVTIERGENAGETITYANTVTAVEQAGAWTGTAQKFDVPLVSETGDTGVVVLARALGADGRPGAIIAAARLGPAQIR
jgi:hypothetical protein